MFQYFFFRRNWLAKKQRNDTQYWSAAVCVCFSRVIKIIETFSSLAERSFLSVRNSFQRRFKTNNAINLHGNKCEICNWFIERLLYTFTTTTKKSITLRRWVSELIETYLWIIDFVFVLYSFRDKKQMNGKENTVTSLISWRQNFSIAHLIHLVERCQYICSHR